MTASDDQKTSSPGALDGISVVEFGEGVSAAYAAKLLGDHGANVVKVERPQGDPTRRRGPFPGANADLDASGLFAYLNTNKLGVCLDVETAAGAATMDRLVARADIFVTDVSAEVLRTVECDPAALRRRHPRLIVVTLSPFGAGGPWSDRVGDELTAYAASGFAYGTPGIPDAAEDLYAEPPLHPSCFVAETIAGVAASIGAIASVLGRRQTGEGCHVDLGVQAVAASVQIRDLMPSSYGAARYNRLLNPTSIGRMPNFYLPCRDGYVTIAAPMEIHWKRLIDAMGGPEWAHQPKYATEKARMENWQDLRIRLSEWAMTCTSAQLEELGNKYEIMLFPFYSVRDLVESDHVRSRDALVEISLGSAAMRMPAAPFKMSATPWAVRRPAPALGQHNELLAAKETSA